MMSAKNGGGGVPPILINLVLAAFVLGWAGSIAAEIFRQGYQAPPGLNEAMIAIVTAFFVAQQRLSADKDDEGKSSKKTPTPPKEAADDDDDDSVASDEGNQ